MAQSKSYLISVLAWLLFVGIIGLTALSFLTQNYGWKIYLELLSHFQLQYFVLSGAGLLLLAVLRRQRLFLLGLICTVILGMQLVTWYWPPKFLTATETGNFRVLMANVNTQNEQYSDVLAFIQQENPDLALFVEVNDIWISELDTLSDKLPYSSGEGNAYNYGVVAYSRYPLDVMERVAFGDNRMPILIGQVSINNQTLSFVGTHPMPPIRPSIFHSRNQQLDQVGQYLQSAEHPKMLLGDLNLSMWSPYYGRLIRQTELKNARKGFGVLPSWPTYGTYSRIPGWASLLFSIPIDHCLLSSEIEVVNVRVGPYLGSDHRPVVVDINL